MTRRPSLTAMTDAELVAQRDALNAEIERRLNDAIARVLLLGEDRPPVSGPEPKRVVTGAHKAVRVEDTGERPSAREGHDAITDGVKVAASSQPGLSEPDLSIPPYLRRGHEDCAVSS